MISSTNLIEREAAAAASSRECTRMRSTDSTAAESATTAQDTAHAFDARVHNTLQRKAAAAPAKVRQGARALFNPI